MKTNKISAIALFAGFISISNCVNAQESKPGIRVDLMDKSVKPGDDFFRYVNGTWFDKTEIPSDRVRWGSFDELRQNTDIDALAILKEATANKKLDPNSDQAKAVNVFVTYMDTVSRNKLGIKPIKPTLDKINAIKNVDDLNKLILELQPEGSIGFYSMYIGADAKNSNRNIVNVTLGSLGLPDRDYYVSDDARQQRKTRKICAHVERMLQYLGESEATS
jgi:putative endopeptidase